MGERALARQLQPVNIDDMWCAKHELKQPCYLPADRVDRLAVNQVFRCDQRGFFEVGYVLMRLAQEQFLSRRKENGARRQARGQSAAIDPNHRNIEINNLKLTQLCHAAIACDDPVSRRQEFNWQGAVECQDSAAHQDAGPFG